MPGRDGGVRVEGLREFRRDLKRVSPEVNVGLRVELKRIGETVAAEARGAAVKRTGRYAASIRPYVAGAGVAVGSRLPQANVLHWGGTISPRGVPITFRQRPVISQAVERHEQQIVDRMGDVIERAARTAGWK
jgi:phage gpG-like protein